MDRKVVEALTLSLSLALALSLSLALSNSLCHLLSLSLYVRDLQYFFNTVHLETCFAPQWRALFGWKCALCHNCVHFLNISTTKRS